MTGHRPIIAAAFLLASLAAQAETLGEKSGVNATLGIASTTADFVREVAVAGKFAVQSGELAAARTTGPTRQFAKALVVDRGRMTDQLRGLARSAKIDVPMVLDDAHRNALEHLGRLHGDDFDLAYHSELDARHQHVVSLFKRYAQRGDNAALRTWAEEMLPQLEASLAMAKALDK